MRGLLVLVVLSWALSFGAYKMFAEPEIAHAQALLQHVANALKQH